MKDGPPLTVAELEILGLLYIGTEYTPSGIAREAAELLGTRRLDSNVSRDLKTLLKYGLVKRYSFGRYGLTDAGTTLVLKRAEVLSLVRDADRPEHLYLPLAVKLKTPLQRTVSEESEAQRIEAIQSTLLHLTFLKRNVATNLLRMPSADRPRQLKRHGVFVNSGDIFRAIFENFRLKQQCDLLVFLESLDQYLEQTIDQDPIPPIQITQSQVDEILAKTTYREGRMPFETETPRSPDNSGAPKKR